MDPELKRNTLKQKLLIFYITLISLKLLKEVIKYFKFYLDYLYL